MSRQLEAEHEGKHARKGERLLYACNGGLSEAVGRAGGQLTGLAVKYSAVECLLVIKATFPGGPQVAFCGSNDLANAVLKAVHEAERDMLRWRADQWGRPE